MLALSFGSLLFIGPLNLFLPHWMKAKWTRKPKLHDVENSKALPLLVVGVITERLYGMLKSFSQNPLGCIWGETRFSAKAVSHSPRNAPYKENGKVA